MPSFDFTGITLAKDSYTGKDMNLSDEVPQ